MERDERLARIRLIACDVDGTLTDGTLFYGMGEGEVKAFHAHDGLGMVLARCVGLEVAWITGRRSDIVARRAKELGVTALLQGVHDKATALRTLAQERGLTLAEVAFIGDDLNDLPALRVAAIALAPANAVAEVRLAAHVVMEKNGGHGAVREAIERILHARGEYERAVLAYVTGQ
jgi:3-deoxy-D-manno-octulosonate 8-phosphate phosphatase (KDO 8-P phosphatase)